MARVLVTGGTGFIGRHLVQRLVEHGEHVRCLVRDRRRAGVLAPLPVECVVGDITDAASLGPALADVDVVYHLAAATLVVRPALYHTLNAEGTRHLAEACTRQARPPRVVYVSSLAAAGPAPFDRPLTEACPPAPVSDYGRSKLAGERWLRAVADRVPVTVLRPPSVLGPGDHYTLKMLRMARHGLVLVPGRHAFRLSWIYVGDLVDAVLLAAERGRRLASAADGGAEEQGVYFVALEEAPTVLEIARLVARTEGRASVRVIRIPALLVRFGARVNAMRTRWTGRPYWVNPDKIREALAGSWTCAADKARRELGFVCRTDLATALQLTSRWGHAQGLL